MQPIDLSTLCRARSAVSRAITAENPTGEPGGGARATLDASLNPFNAKAARELGPGWKVSPCAVLRAGATYVVADIAGPGVIRHLWIAATHKPNHLRDLVLRMHWDGAAEPAIEVPLGDFFCQAWNGRNHIVALPVNVNSRGAMNCFWPMPFRRRALITVENQSALDCDPFFYQVDYTLEEVAADALYLHASWRRENPTVPGRDLVIADGIVGRGHFVGAFLAWQQNSKGWWGEGEVKLFIDGDREHPTICGTGTEDWFGGAWCFDAGGYSAPCFGFATIEGTCGQVGARMAMYRFHVHDPVFFRDRLRVTCQTLGWRSGERYLQLRDDVSATAWWYQTQPHAPLPPLPGPREREQI